jgi:hypothetical protein
MPALLVAHHRPGFYFRVLEEGEVEAGAEIVKILAGPERLTVADADALLYLPGRDKSGLERALRIPALSAGWRSSFETLLEQERRGGPTTGNPGLRLASGTAPAWVGFRPLRVADKRRESGTGRRPSPRCGDAGPVHRASTDARAPIVSLAAQLFALRRAERGALADQHQKGAERRCRDLRR